MAQLVKNLPAMWETWVLSLAWEDPLEKGKATHSSILAWRIPWTIWFMGLQRVGHDWVTFTFIVDLQYSVSFRLIAKRLSFPYMYGLFLVAQSCRTLCVTPWTVTFQAPLSMGIFQARILQWVSMPSSRGSSQPRDRTQVSHTAGGLFTSWATREAPIYIYIYIYIYSLLDSFHI